MSHTSLGISLILLSAALGALAHALGKKALDYGMTIPAFLALRSLAGVGATGLVFVVLGLASGWPTLTLGAVGMGMAVGICHPVLSNLFYFGGLKGSDLSVMSPLINTSPLFAMILAVVFLHERPSILVLVALLIILTGAVIVPLTGATHAVRNPRRHSARRSAVLGLGSAISIASYLVVGKQALKGVDTRLVVLVLCCTAAVVFSGLALTRRRAGIIDQGCESHLGKAIVCTVVSAVLVYSMCSFLSLSAVKLIGASLTSCFASTNVVFGMILSMFVIHENPSPKRCLGAALILGGCVLCSLARG